MSTQIALVAEKALPALSGSPLTYDAARNVFLTKGYTVPAGNTYFKAIRYSKRLVVLYHIGVGYCRTFLNGITLAAWNGKSGEIIAQKFWGGCCNWRDFSERDAKDESVKMLVNFLEGQAKALGRNVSERELLDFSQSMINEVHCKQLTA